MPKCVAVGPRFVPESALPRKMSVLPVNVERISRELYGLARRRDDFPHQLFWEAHAKGMLMPFPEVDRSLQVSKGLSVTLAAVLTVSSLRFHGS
jgi:hypothetical protein